MKAFLAILAILTVFWGCQYHKHRHTKNFYHHEVHNHPEEDLSKKSFTIEQNIDLYLDELPQNN
jgi:hypothetical protein